MRHGVKKIKFRSGQDANEMLMRKLLYGFFTHGKITTTLSKGKALKPLVEHLAHKIRERNESNKNYLLRYFPNEKQVEGYFKNLGETMNKRTGGYVRLIRLYARESDNAMMARLEWTDPVVKPEAPRPVESVKETKAVTKPVSKKAAAKKTP